MPHCESWAKVSVSAVSNLPFPLACRGLFADACKLQSDNEARKAFGNLSAVNKVRSEEWFSQLYRGIPSKEPDAGVHNCGGIEEAFLRKLVRQAGKPSLLDPRVGRVIDCPECRRQLEELRHQAPVRTQVRLSTLSIAVVLAIAIPAAAGLWKSKHSVAPSQVAISTRIVDLTSSASTRGGLSPARIGSLPRSTISLTLILPAASDAGEYRITVTPTQKVGEPRLSATGTAVERNHQTRLTVTLGLERLEPGTYLLSTIQRDGISHDYPLEVAP